MDSRRHRLDGWIAEEHKILPWPQVHIKENPWKELSMRCVELQRAYTQLTKMR